MARQAPKAMIQLQRTPHQLRVLAGVALWASFYRANIHLFIRDYLHISLHVFQMILVLAMDRFATFVFIAARGIGKTFLCAVYLVARCILYPGTHVCISSGTRGQSHQIFEKILTELVPKSPELYNEIDWKQTKTGGQDAMIVLKNTSTIKIVTASDSARSNRAQVLLIDEFRMVKKDTINTVLRKFFAGPRHPGYMDKPEYKNRKDLQERNKIIYASSGWYQDHWSYQRCKDVCKNMINPEHSGFVCGIPYYLGVEEGMLMEEDILDEMSEADFSDIKFSMEMEALFWGESMGSFYNFEAINRNRHIEYAMLPAAVTERLPKAEAELFKIPEKTRGEIRVLAVDVALMASRKHKNDAMAFTINQMLPTKAGRYSHNLVYLDAKEGMRSEQAALTIRKMFEEYKCDWLVLDVKGVGLPIYDLLAMDLPDPESGEVYPALTCKNNEDLALRCTVRNARPVIWAMQGSSKLNSECAILLRDGFRSGRIRLLMPEDELDTVLGDAKGYGSLTSSEKIAIKLPYINTTLLIGELINLQHEESDGVVRIYEKTGARKDRYSSISYNFWVSNQIETELRSRMMGDEEYKRIERSFVFRAPSTFKRNR